MLTRSLFTGAVFLATKPIVSSNPYSFYQTVPASQSAAKLSTAELYSKIRKDFLAVHNKYAKLQPLENIDHVIIYLNEHLTLLQKNAEGHLYEIDKVATPAHGDHYNLLKSISHLSVWLNMILQSMVENKGRSWSHMKDLLGLLVLLKSIKAQDDLSLRQESVAIDKIMKVVYKAMEVKSMGQIQCLHAQLLQDIKKSNENYAAQATQLQLKGMHQIMTKWAQNNKMKLANTCILIATTQGPREGLIEKQYFQDLYLKAGIADMAGKVVCAEMLPEQMATVSQSSLIDFLKRQHINREIGLKMLGDVNAMNKDVLGGYAPPVFKQLCPFHVKAESPVNDGTAAVLK